MGKYTSLIHKAETPKLQEGGKEDRVNIHNVNINNIHNNTDIVIDTPLSSRPKDTLQGSPPVEIPQGVTSGSKEESQPATNLRTTNLTNLKPEPTDDKPAAWATEWAGDLMSKALRYLNERYVEDADLSGLGHWHDEIVAAGVAEDQERYRKAVRGYVWAGLRAFDQARKETA